MFRFKTGTPARVDKRSIDFSKMEEQFGDERIVPFSFSTDPDSIQKEQVFLLADLYQWGDPSDHPGIIWTVRRCFQEPLREQALDIVRLSRTR